MKLKRTIKRICCLFIVMAMVFSIPVTGVAEYAYGTEDPLEEITLTISTIDA